MNPTCPAVVRLRGDSGKLEITIPRRLARAAGVSLSRYVALTLTDDGAGLVIAPVARL